MKAPLESQSVAKLLVSRLPVSGTRQAVRPYPAESPKIMPASVKPVPKTVNVCEPASVDVMAVQSSAAFGPAQTLIEGPDCCP